MSTDHGRRARRTIKAVLAPAWTGFEGAAPGRPAAAQVLVTPVFSAVSAVLALVLSITVPGKWRTVVKTNPQTGVGQSYQAATWVSHHELAYLDRSSGSFSGPFKLADEPSLAQVSAVATAADLFLWTVDEAAELIKAKGFKSGAAVRPTTRLQAFPLGGARRASRFLRRDRGR